MAVSPPRPLVAGNWKMNGIKASLVEVDSILHGYTDPLKNRVDMMVCPPATLVALAAERAKNVFAIGGQDCHANSSGAHTGDVAAAMLADCGANAVIVGHSERRTDHAETSALVANKALAAQQAGLTAIICVGETREQRDAGKALAVVSEQVRASLPEHFPASHAIIAYEPVWAIGTGLVPTVGDVAEMHACIRALLLERYGEEGHTVRILYGGSVKPSNAKELLGIENVNGALVGGASLKAEDFLGIASAYL